MCAHHLVWFIASFSCAMFIVARSWISESYRSIITIIVNFLICPFSLAIPPPPSPLSLSPSFDWIESEPQLKMSWSNLSTFNESFYLLVAVISLSFALSFLLFVAYLLYFEYFVIFWLRALLSSWFFFQSDVSSVSSWIFSISENQLRRIAEAVSTARFS